MANYSTSANVVLSVNGRQAQQVLNNLQKDARRLEQQLAKAAAAGDKATMKKLQRELKSTNNLIKQMQGASKSAEQVLARLDKATPKELQKTLRTLQQQLNGIERGSAAWNAHVAKIRAVKAEMSKLNASMATQKSLWDRMNGWLNNCQTAILGLGAAITGLVMAGRKAVQSFADMEEQLANTQKYTRMTRDKVMELNEAFMGMDTRLPREQLNLLAQEAGRLGYNTVSSVQEYVEAASIINVALVDLGEGATQTIAKLSNIFGMEQMYGVRDSMLKIGSTVNHLSQNCTAAKPFIVEFAQRMAGIGATAKMTIPEIMAFAATLDANGQKVEMSATALQRTIMNLYKAPGEMAKKVGLDANKFIETLNKSTTEGVMMFLEALNKIGEDKALAVLSPLFQDLGLDGARVSSVLSNLSSHLDFLKWQMGEAAEAFREGTSASGEYAIFNNTVQAEIDKARKRVSELSIELGEKLYPIMKHIYKSSSAFLRVLNVMVQFFLEHKSAILTLTGALVAYNAVMAVYNARVNIANRATLLWNSVLKGLRALLGPVKLLVAGLTNTVQYFTNGLQTNYAMQQRWSKALKAMSFANWAALAITAITAVILVWEKLANKVDKFKRKMDDAIGKMGEFDLATMKEKEELDKLFGALRGAREGSEALKKAKDQLMKQYGSYIKDLINEKGTVTNLEEAYTRLAYAIRIANQERGIKNAKESIDNQFQSEMGDLSSNLYKTLLDYGAQPIEAAKLQAAVVSAMQMQVPIDNSVINRINSLSASGRQSVDGSSGRGAKLLYNTKGILNIITGGMVGSELRDDPAAIVMRMYEVSDLRKAAMNQVDVTARTNHPLRNFDDNWLENAIKFAELASKAGGSVMKIDDAVKGTFEMVEVTADEAKQLLRELSAEKAYRTGAISKGSPVPGNPEFTIDDYTPYVTDKDRRKAETEARRAAIKAKKEFKDELNNAKGVWEADEAQNISDYAAGLKSWTEYLLKKHQLEVKYFEDREKVYKKWHLEEDEDYQELLKKKEEMQAEWIKKNSALVVEQAKIEQQAKETQVQMDFNTPGSAIYQNEEVMQEKLFRIRIKYLKKMQAAYNNSSEEWHNYEVQIQQAEAAEQLRRQKLLAQRIAEWKKKYEFKEVRFRLEMELRVLEEAYEKKLIKEEEYLKAREDLRKKYRDEYMPESSKPSADSPKRLKQQEDDDLDKIKSLYDQGILTEEEYESAKDWIRKNYMKKHIDRVRRLGSEETNQLLDIYEAWKAFFDKTEEDGGNWATRLAALSASVFAVMNAGMQQASQLIQAEADLQVAKTEKKYDRELELAEGNSYLTKKIEKQKADEIAKLKNDASRKAFSMQLIQAVAQTATNALNAYGSAAQVPVIGYILAPIAAAMALAAGAVQIATIKKQQQASEAQGYSEGGFTPEGDKDNPVGIVHSGEWVASQKLTHNPKIRPLLVALDQAQRNNTIGSLSHDAVSSLLPATAGTTQGAALKFQQPNVVVNVPQKPQDNRLAESIDKLNKRLDQPFGAVVTVAGDHGIVRAQNEYDNLLKNKSPKYRK